MVPEYVMRLFALYMLAFEFLVLRANFETLGMS